MSEVKLSRLEQVLRSRMQHYNEKLYWIRREKAIAADSKLPKLYRLFCLFYVKRCDAFNNASTGAHLGYGAQFAEKPILPHGLYGIIISHRAAIGAGCTIFHQVTIGESGQRPGAPSIGSNVLIGAGAKIIGPVKIGNNVRIGANCVIVHDVPDNCTVVAQEGIILKKNRKQSEISVTVSGV